MTTTSIQCQYTGCVYKAEHESEAVAIAMLMTHNNIHQGSASRGPAVKQRVPKMDRPVLKQDINDEEWQTFEAEWKRFKRLTEIPDADLADQLIECCEKSLWLPQLGAPI